MPRMHFHLTIDDQYFHDQTGQEVGSLAAAHSRAISLASRLMSFCEIERREIRTERWVVTIEEQGRSPMSVIVGPERIAEATRQDGSLDCSLSPGRQLLWHDRA